MEATYYDWRTNFILLVSVIVTVVAALLLAQMDELQSQEAAMTTAVVTAPTPFTICFQRQLAS